MRYGKSPAFLFTLGWLLSLIACSKSSTAPQDPVVGIWHVSVSPGKAALVPSTFDLALAASGKGYSGTLPTFQYGTTTFDSVGSVQAGVGSVVTTAVMGVFASVGDSLLGVEYTRGVASKEACWYVWMVGALNQAKDTITGYFEVWDENGDFGGCQDAPSFTAVKQK